MKTNEELKELARVLDGIANGEDWEFKGLSEIWNKGHLGINNPQRLAADGWQIRLKPWSLPPPPEGMEWHRSDGWTKEMLPEGYRPHLDGEVNVAGDEWFNGEKWIRVHLNGGTPSSAFCNLYRTNRPLPQPDPLAEVKDAHAAGKVIQKFWMNPVAGNKWVDDPNPNWSLTPERYRIKPTLRIVQLGPDGVKAGDEFLAQSGERRQWSMVTHKMVCFGAFSRTFQQLVEEGWKIRSIGGEWRPCSKEEEVES